MKNLRQSIVLVTGLIIGLSSCEFNSDLTEKQETKSKVEQAKTADIFEDDIILQVEASDNNAFRARVTLAFASLLNGEIWDAIKPQVVQTGEESVQTVIANIGIRDDILMRYSDVSTVEVAGTPFSELLTEKYLELHPESGDDIATLNQRLPGLRFNLPEESLTDFASWEEAGFPLVASNFDANYTPLAISKEDAISIVGEEKVAKMESIVSEGSYYIFEDDIIIKSSSEPGFGAITIKDDVLPYSSSITEGGDVEIELAGKLSTASPNQITPYIPIVPTKCTWPICSQYFASAQWLAYAANLQNIANKECRDMWACIPCCDSPNAPGPSYYTFIFEPTNIACARTMQYVQVLGLATIGN